MFKLFSLVPVALLAWLMTACSTHKKLVYFQANPDPNSKAAQHYTPTLKTDDLLSIIVTGEDLEAATPFNLPVIGVQQTVNSGYTMGNPAPYGYLIDANGEIAMPVIGKVVLAGLTRMEAVELLVQKLSPYLKNPVVQMQILNYKITVLGDVRNPGTYKIPNERITLLEAIGLAGDLKMTGKRKNILVVRDENGSKTAYRIDLTSNELFQSPVYYLNQNDVVYIEPNNAARTESTIWRTTGPIFISLTSLVITTVALLTR